MFMYSSEHVAMWKLKLLHETVYLQEHSDVLASHCYQILCGSDA